MKISNTSTKMFNDCNLKYRLQYVDRLRAKTTGSALIFGNALDKAFNELLVSRNLGKATAIYKDTMQSIEYNKKTIYVPTSPLITYFKADFDQDLLIDEDIKLFWDAAKALEYKSYLDETTYVYGCEELGCVVDEINYKKKNKEKLTEVEQALFALANYLSMTRKGLILLKTYHDEILPKIQEVLSIQEEIALTNNEGDSITGFIDFVAKIDGKTYILDNKTCSDFKYYPQDSAQKSQQLVLYKHATQHKYDCQGVGYIVMLKKLDKTTVKICETCGNDGTGKRHKTCDKLVGKQKCGGDWKETYTFKCLTDIILNDVPDELENNIIDLYDNTVQAIKTCSSKDIFEPNWSSCGEAFSPIKCQYYNLCHKNDDSDLEIVE